ncbi:hypothetical protein OJF2_35780 [Aquisphaera giovannonii]|uniref:Uncharacterized protein n=1 Tax=Aquisphaera giovannonii TaxID=406548 RepID=A0A5B9W333_9BACT|nr:hypothetical protein [Aquisphaera giovannonii]QEH35033.1 hypothetical protein OJF2_35780 [Aquisphaera giovannonii]
MLYKTVMVLGVLAMAWSATWFYRVFAGLVHLQGADMIPMIVGGIAGGVGAWYFVPRLFKYEAERRRALK